MTLFEYNYHIQTIHSNNSQAATPHCSLMLPFPSSIRQFAAQSGCLTLIWTLAGILAWPLAAQDFQPAYDLAKPPGASLDAPSILAHGKLPGDGFGRVIRTGDVNGDGIEDLIVGSATASAGATRVNAGTVCIWFGSGQIGGVFDAASSVGRAPDVTLLGARAGDSLTSGGALIVADVSGDGIADILLGAPGADGPSASRDGAGESYIVFGRDIFPNVLDLAVQGDGGADVTIHGASEGDSLTSGGALTAGDVNGDGITDLLLGALAADGPDESRPSAGEAYVIFGREEFTFTLDLGIQGPGGADVTLYGADEGDFLAYDGAVKAADVNADGIPDILLGAVGADGPDETREAAGECYIVFGRPGLPPVLDLKISGPGNADVTLYGVSPDDQMTSGGSIVVADVNGDGIDDLLLGTPGGDGPNDTRSGAGESYIVLGRPFFPPVMDLAFQGHGGADVTLYGASAEDSLTSGGALAAADVDKDGIADILLGAGLADGPEESRLSAGEACIVLGRPVFPVTLDLAIQGPGGADVTLYGASPGDNLAIGGALLAADVNQDGRADLILGALLADGPEEGLSNAGEACVILGRDAFPPVLDLAIHGPGGADITLYGATANDQLTRERSLAAGDINGDGIPDILLGARDADGPGEARGGAGEVTVILGSGIPFTGPQITLHQPAGTYLADGGGRYFGAVLLNNIGTRLFTVVNTGTEPLTGIAITLGGVNEDDYSVDRAALPAELAPGQSGAFLVTFAPGTLGLRAAAMQIHSSDTSRSPYDVRLTGIGAAPELSVEQPAGSPRHTGSTRAYGGVATGYSKTLVFVLKNIGTADLEGVIPSLTGADAARFSFPAPASSTIAPGQSLSLPVTFTPGVLGDFSAALHVISSVSPDAPYVVHLTGSGVPPAPELDLEQPAHTVLESGGARAYGSVSIGASKNLVFTLRNTGTAPLTGIAFSTAGENPADFLPLSPTLPDVPPGGSAAFTLAFAPQARGARAAELRIA
ncbi:MAG TPA: choice-of-anchor D domain-containing protein, partial [Prosthecobacter sp.]|nr:choice-of-anchor D domain-containing protein [Prosthecobacter sp.]